MYDYRNMTPDQRAEIVAASDRRDTRPLAEVKAEVRARAGGDDLPAGVAAVLRGGVLECLPEVRLEQGQPSFPRCGVGQEIPILRNVLVRFGQQTEVAHVPLIIEPAL